MRTINDPAQSVMFDPLEKLSPTHLRSFINSPEGLFRAAILAILPAKELAKNFCPTEGAPTKELYSMAGLMLMMEYHDWTVEEAVNAYMWNGKIQLALNIYGASCTLSERTIYRYLKIFVDNDEHLLQKALDDITKTLIELSGINTQQQRVDSTHVFSNMATFGRTRLMGVTIKRFLTQVIRHDPEAYAALDEDLKKRYQPSQGKLFADTAKGKGRGKAKEQNQEEHYRLLRQTVAEDMLHLIGIFESHDRFQSASTFKALVQVFHEQCEIIGDAVQVRKKTGGSVIQNPSDLEATYDGHKGVGYQVQLAETCDVENEVQFITAVIPETAAESDMAAVVPVLEALEKNDLLPTELLADAGYGSDKNIETADEKGVELVSPTKGNADLSAKEETIAESLTLDDFVVDEASEEVVGCPAGHAPESSVHDETTGKTKTVMPQEACSGCAFSGACPIRRVGEKFTLTHTGKERRLACRRREESTEVFRKRYARRSGIEATNSGIKEVTGLRRLRVRGSPRVYMSIWFKVAGWNIRRGAACSRVMEMVRQRLGGGSFGDTLGNFWLRRRVYLECVVISVNFAQKLTA